MEDKNKDELYKKWLELKDIVNEVWYFGSSKQENWKEGSPEKEEFDARLDEASDALISFENEHRDLLEEFKARESRETREEEKAYYEKPDGCFKRGWK